MKIYLDPGHNHSGGDTGASGFGLREEDASFAIGARLAELLRGAGHEVKLSRNSASENVGNGTLNSSLSERCRMANEWGAELFCSIHCNAANGAAHGTETLVYSLSGAAASVAKEVQKAIVAHLGTTDRGVKERPGLYVLKHTQMPAILVETAFIDNEADCWLLKTRQDGFAAAIAEGITGGKIEETEAEKVQELTDIHDIVWEYGYRGLVTDEAGMEEEMRQNPDGRLYWLARKTLQFIRERGF